MILEEVESGKIVVEELGGRILILAVNMAVIIMITLLRGVEAENTERKLDLMEVKLQKKITLGAYIVGGSLILGDIMLGGPTGEGIVPALIIIGW